MTQDTKYHWIRWFKAAGVRALRTWAQAFVAALPVVGFTLGSVDWIMCASSATGAAILSLLMSLSGLPEVDGEVKETTDEQ